MTDRPDSTENKDEWCALGESLERVFLERCWRGGIGVSRNPDKVNNAYTFDAMLTLPCDIKTVSTPFHTAHRYGVPAKYAVTLNGKDIARYAEKYPNIVIVFDVAHDLYQGVHLAPLSRVIEKIDQGAVQAHYYQRRVNDERNAKYSFVLDVRWFPTTDGKMIDESKAT